MLTSSGSKQCCSFITGVLLLMLLPKVTLADQPVVRIAAASSMRFVLDELLDNFAAAGHSHNIQAVYGSSGNLYRQIVQGAPYDIFLTADSSLMDKLAQVKRLQVNAQDFGRGELMLYSQLSIEPVHLLESFKSAIRVGELGGRSFKFAMANPAHAPYGKAAQQALQGWQLWEQGRMFRVVAESVSQAAQFARSGAAQFAFVSATLTLFMQGTSVPVPTELYEPVRHSIASLNNSDTAQQFISYVGSDQAQSTLKKYGLR